MKNIEDFKQYYDTELRAVLEPLEIERKVCLKKSFIAAAVLFPISVVIAGFVMKHTSDPVWPTITLLIGLLISLSPGMIFTYNFRTHFKKNVISPVIKYLSSDLTYTPEGTISQSVFDNSTLFEEEVVNFKGEDLIEGQVDNIQISFSEVHAQYERTSSRNKNQTTSHTLFKGQFFVADFNKHFQGNTIVLPDYAEKYFGSLGQKLDSKLFKRDDLIKLEDPEFEKEFMVYATDPVEAQDILSPAMMQRILAIKKHLKVPIRIGFVNSKLYMAVSTKKNMFEPRIMRSILKFEVVCEYMEDLILAIGIVEYINQNTPIGTKD